MTRFLGPITLLLQISLFAMPVNAALGPVLFTQPRGYTGLASDSEFINLSGLPSWQRIADDFQINETGSVCGVRWWAIYGLTGVNQTPEELSPPLNEVLQLRFYADAGGLPGKMISQATYQNIQQVPTGIRFESPQRNEYQFEADVSPCFIAEQNQRYWVSVEQVDDLASHFRWEATYDAPGLAFQNPAVGSTWTTVPTLGMSFELTTVPEPTTGALMLSALLAIRFREPKPS